MSLSHTSAAKRLLQDLKQLKEEPIVGANAEPFRDDLFKWYGIVIAMEGSPYAGIPIRFCLEFTTEYPNEPPNAYFETAVFYSGGATYKDSFGRIQVCLNIFGNFRSGHPQWAEASEGWTSSYTVQTILLSVQALMFSNMLSKKEEDIEKTKNSAQSFLCPLTDHMGWESTTWFPQVIKDQVVAETIAKLSGRVTFDPLRDFYICYVNKSTARGEAVLGYGVQIENPRIGTLSSPCEYLSLDAFKLGTRRSATNKPFQYWLPILIKSIHWPQIRPFFLGNVNFIWGKIQPGQYNETGIKVLKVCSSIMNSLVVEIMNNEGNVTANDKFINGYMAVCRLMMEYANDDPKIVTAADLQLRTFIENPLQRTKAHVSNLGELLICLTISKDYTWGDISQYFQEECDARNVSWYIQGNHKTGVPAKYPELASETLVHGRASKVFEATVVSRNLVMFQVSFSKVAKTLTREIMDSNDGLAPDDLRAELKDLYNLIITVNSWNSYFDWLEMPNVSEQGRDSQLVAALKRSENQHYHMRPSRGKQNCHKRPYDDRNVDHDRRRRRWNY